MVHNPVSIDVTDQDNHQAQKIKQQIEHGDERNPFHDVLHERNRRSQLYEKKDQQQNG
jgi:hypothetical protein